MYSKFDITIIHKILLKIVHAKKCFVFCNNYRFISRGRLGHPRPPSVVLETELPTMTKEIKAERKTKRKNHRFFSNQHIIFIRKYK